MASVSAGAERAAGLRLVPGLTLVLVREVAFGRDLVLAVTVLDFAVLREALFGLAELLGFAAGLAVEALLLAAADFGLAADLAVEALPPAEVRDFAGVADLAAVRLAVRAAAARPGFAVLELRGLAGLAAPAADLAVESVFAAAVRALAAVLIALVAVFMVCMAVDMVLADDVALVAAAVILPAADVTLVAADDTVRAATAGVGEFFAPLRAVVLRAVVLRELRAVVLRGLVLRELDAVVLRELAFAAGRAGFAVVLRVALTPVDLVEFDFGRLAELFTALPLLDLARVLLAVLRRAAARSVL
ncbi:MAG TPA: hypothetical protein DEH11_21590 [Actinobacteria bacterium]|nr:hypothetical protein [Actinomycetota bacterium]